MQDISSSVIGVLKPGRWSGHFAGSKNRTRATLPAHGWVPWLLDLLGMRGLSSLAAQLHPCPSSLAEGTSTLAGLGSKSPSFPYFGTDGAPVEGARATMDRPNMSIPIELARFSYWGLETRKVVRVPTA